MEYYIVRRGGHHYYESFLKSPPTDIRGDGILGGKTWTSDEDFGSLRNAHQFDHPALAHECVRKHKDDFQGSVIQHDGKELYELVEDIWDWNQPADLNRK